MRIWSSLLVVSLTAASVAVVACSSDSASGGSCGSFNIYTAADPAECEPALDEKCCAQQEKCASEPGCPEIVACVNKCPKPRTDDCVNACKPDPDAPASAYADQVQVCSFVEGPAGCGWPQGLK
jgi:hypothetical protein